MKRMTKIGIYGMAVWLLSACGNGTPDYDATGTFEATEVIVSAEAAGKLLQLEVEEGTRLKAGEEDVYKRQVHSGDATIQFPPQKLYVETVRRIKRISREIAKALNISGPFNIQYLSLIHIFSSFIV